MKFFESQNVSESFVFPFLYTVTHFHFFSIRLLVFFLLQQIHFLIKSDLNWSLKAEASFNSLQYTGFEADVMALNTIYDS